MVIVNRRERLIVVFLLIISCLVSFNMSYVMYPIRSGLISKGSATVWKKFSRCFSEQLKKETATVATLPKNFITNIIENDLASGKTGGRVVTRFPPEPNGYLHIGHAKSINLNFELAQAYNGITNMRLDDTNPAKEDMEYVLSILDDVRWIVTGNTKAEPAPWNGSVKHASDYFPVIYDCAEYLIKQGMAYVDDLTTDEIKAYRGTLTEPGKNSPYRDRSVEENLQLFREMRAGKFPDGRRVLRAKIDMANPNLNLRDPTLYRIKHMDHPMTGNQWCIYPMYDFAHVISDAVEGITHSLCTLEFESHRPLYDWIVDALLPSGLLPFQKEGWRPYQYEFSRLNIQYTVLSKRKLIQLIREGHVHGWDDPRMPTICGIRRRGYTANILKLFCSRVGISKSDSNIDYSVLEDCAREVLDQSAYRAFAIEKPLKVTLFNYPTESNEIFTVDNHPKDSSYGKRSLTFSSELFINREDFFDTGANQSIPPPKGFKRLLPGGQVRLKFAYVITCEKVIRDPQTNEVIELQCRYHPDTKSGHTPEGMKKVKGIIQWLSKKDAHPVTFHLYDRLFQTPSPGENQSDGNFLKDLNPNSLTILSDALIESNVVADPEHLHRCYQLERIGYFCCDEKDSNLPEKKFVFNRIVTLKDGWKA